MNAAPTNTAPMNTAPMTVLNTADTALPAAARECERIGRTAGLAAGLAAVLVGRDVAAIAPGRYAAVPAAPDTESPGVRRHSLADREGIVFAECQGERPPASTDLAEIGALLAAVRLGVMRHLLDLAVAHLSERDSGGEPLIRKQLVTGAVADVIAGVELLREQALAQRDPVALGDLHTRIDDLGWQTAKLFGASGYIADHPARALYVSALCANTWSGREGAGE